MFLSLAFVVVPEDGKDWLTNARASGAVIVWAGAVVAAMLVISKVPFRKARPATSSRPARPALTVGSAFGVVVSYFARPFARWFTSVVQDANAPQFDTLRSENTEQHAETAARLSALEEAVKDLSAWRDTVDTILRPSEAMEALVSQMQEMASIVQADRHAAKAGIAALNGQMQLLVQMMADKQSTSSGNQP